MKKIISFIMVVVMSMTMLIGCGSTSSSSDSSSSKKIPKDKMKVGFIYNTAMKDGGWMQSHDDGRLAVEKQLGVKTIYKENVPETEDVEKAAEDMIGQGCNVIIACSFGYMNYILKVAKKHPDVKFLHCSGYQTAPNVGVYFERLYQPIYLSGIIAGLKTKTNVIGYVGSMPIPELYRQIDAFALGVQSVNKNAKVKVIWTHTWYDPAKEKEAGKALVDSGCDVLGEAMNTMSSLQAAADKGFTGIGFNRDVTTADPKVYMTAPVYNWGVYYVDQVKKIMDGTWKPESWWKGMESGAVDLAPLRDSVPAEAKAAVDKAKADIISGKNKIFTGPIKDQSGTVKVKDGQTLTDDELYKIDWFVEGIDGNNEK